MVTGFAAERVEERAAELERRHGIRLELVYNDRAEEWNNAYSLWLARDAFADGILLVNGDTVHPPQRRGDPARGTGPRRAARPSTRRRTLGEEEMKILAAKDGALQRISKEIDPAGAAGEYIGVALIEPAAAEPLADALEATWRRDPSLYYEDGFQELADRGGDVRVVPIGAVDWVEVDDHGDLARARELAFLS